MHRARTERGHEVLAAGEVVGLEPGLADLGRAMRVAPDGAGYVPLLRERVGALVGACERLTGVEDLDGIDERPETFERLAPDVIQTIAAEGMGHRDEPALIFDALDGLLSGEIARDRPFQEQSDDLAVARRHFLADDHTKPVGDLPEPQSALDGVVIRRAHHVDPRRLERPRLRREGRAAVGRVLAVGMHVESDPALGHVRTIRRARRQAPAGRGPADPTRSASASTARMARGTTAVSDSSPRWYAIANSAHGSGPRATASASSTPIRTAGADAATRA